MKEVDFSVGVLSPEVKERDDEVEDWKIYVLGHPGKEEPTAESVERPRTAMLQQPGGLD